jgi:hypothetical protein
MGNQSFLWVGSVEVVGTKDGHALGFERNLEIICGGNNGVTLEGVLAERLIKEREHFFEFGEIRSDFALIGRGEERVNSHARKFFFTLSVTPNLN